MEKAEDIISALFNNSSSEHGSFVQINRNWRKIVGDERLADHCRPEDMDGNSMRISFDHPGWIQSFKMNQRLILKRINTQYPDLNIQSLILYLKDGEHVPRRVKKAEKPVPEEEKKAIRADFSGIEDDELKQRLMNLKKKMDND
jgi:hypothetical protein